MALEPISARSFRAVLSRSGHPALTALESLEQHGFILIEPIIVETYGPPFQHEETDTLALHLRLHFDLISPSGKTIYLVTVTQGKSVELSLHIEAEQEGTDSFADNVTGWPLLAQELLRREGPSQTGP
jgi:hypothetical protein